MNLRDMLLTFKMSAFGGGNSGGGDGPSTEDALVSGTLTSYTNDRLTSIVSHAFCYNAILTEVNFPAATSIGTYAFYQCKALTKANIPKVTSIASSAFYGASALTEANFPLVTSLAGTVFYDCIALTKVNFPVATSASSSGFYNCKVLTKVNFPAAASIEDRAFGSCEALTEANFPVATSINGTMAFFNCKVLAALILRSATLCTLKNKAAFDGSSIKNGTGYIYVPAALVDTYKSATNWSNFAAQFRALEDYTVDGTTTGELDPTKTGVQT